MIENTTTLTKLNPLKKKVWHEPQLIQLNVKETKGGTNIVNFEFDFFNWGEGS